MNRTLLDRNSFAANATALLTQEQARTLALRPDDTVWLGMRDFHLLPLA